MKILIIDEVSIYLTGKVTLKPTRLISFMSLGASTILSITALFSYVFNQTFKNYQTNHKIKPQNIGWMFLSFTNIFLSDSITLNLTAFLVTAMCLILFYKISAYLFVTTSLRDRYIDYFYKGELQDVKNVWFPKIADCNISALISGCPILANLKLNPECNPAPGFWNRTGMVDVCFYAGLLLL